MHRDTRVSARSAAAITLAGVIAAASLTGVVSAAIPGPGPNETVVRSAGALRTALGAGKRSIYLMPGTYDIGGSRLWLGGTKDKPLTIRGAGRDQTILVARYKQDALVSVRGGYVTLQDMELNSKQAQSISHQALTLQGAGINIINTDVVGSPNNGLGGQYLDNVRIIGNRFIDNGRKINHQVYFVPRLRGAVIADNEFFGSAAEMAVKIRTMMNGTGVIRNVALVGNEVHDRTGYGSAIGVDNPTRQRTMANIIAADNAVPRGNVAQVLDTQTVTADTTTKVYRSSDVQSVSSLGKLFAGVDAYDVRLGAKAGLKGDAGKAAILLDKFAEGLTLSRSDALLVARLLASAAETSPTTVSAAQAVAKLSAAATPSLTSVSSMDSADRSPILSASQDVLGPQLQPVITHNVPEPAAAVALLALAVPALRRRAR